MKGPSKRSSAGLEMGAGIQVGLGNELRTELSTEVDVRTPPTSTRVQLMKVQIAGTDTGIDKVQRVGISRVP